MNGHLLKGSHRENWSFVNVLITISLIELNPLSIMKERKDVGVEGGTSIERELAGDFSLDPAGTSCLLLQTMKTSHVINSRDQKPALFFHLMGKHCS